MRLILFIFLLIITNNTNLFSFNIDSILKENSSLTQPCIIINLTSTDCITCRAGSKKIIDAIYNNDKVKMYLVADDKNMSVYFSKYPEIYNRFNIIYNKTISNYLALGPSSTVCLVEQSQITRFTLSQVNEDTLQYIKKWQEKISSVKKQIKIKDSLFNDLSDVTFNNDYVFIYNEQYQNGLQYDFRTQKKHYYQPEYHDSVVEGLYDILRKSGMKKLTTADLGKQWLKEDGVAPITVHSINAIDNSVLFKLYAISIDTIMNENNDTVSSANPQIFVIRNTKSENNEIINFKNYNNASLFQSITIGGDTLFPLSSIKHQIHNNNIYLAYWDINHSKSLSINGRYVKLPTKVSIAEFKYNVNGVTKPEKVYEIKNDSGTNFIFRISDNGFPIVVNNSSKSILLLEKGIELHYEDLTQTTTFNILKCFDISLQNDTLMYVATTQNKKSIVGYYALKTQKRNIVIINDIYDYDNMKINGKNILSCKKNTELNELYLDLFSF